MMSSSEPIIQVLTPAPCLADDSILDEAYAWLCKQRRNHGHNNSIWHLRYHWADLKPKIQQQLLSGTYQLQPLQAYCIEGQLLSSWDAADSLVLKALCLVIQPLFTIKDFPNCTHLKGGGGVHGAIRRVSEHLGSYQQILKSDVYHYYESIDHQIVNDMIAPMIACPIIRGLIEQYCQRVEIHNGEYFHQKIGLPKGCPLSPLIAALYLKPLDEAMVKYGFYIRFMDDWLVLVKTKRQLRRLIKITHRLLSSLKIKMHPDKTYFGAVKKGFDFLGLHFGEPARIAEACIKNHREKSALRYAQGATQSSIEMYKRRWVAWCDGLKACLGSRQIPIPCYTGCGWRGAQPH